VYYQYNAQEFLDLIGNLPQWAKDKLYFDPALVNDATKALAQDKKDRVRGIVPAIVVGALVLCGSVTINEVSMLGRLAFVGLVSFVCLATSREFVRWTPQVRLNDAEKAQWWRIHWLLARSSNPFQARLESTARGQCMMELVLFAVEIQEQEDKLQDMPESEIARRLWKRRDETSLEFNQAFENYRILDLIDPVEKKSFFSRKPIKRPDWLAKN